MGKIPHSFSLDVELVMLLKRYDFINWSNVVTAYMRRNMETYGTELEELFKVHEKLKHKTKEGS